LVVVTEYETQLGSVMEATIMAVAIPVQLVHSIAPISRSHPSVVAT
jgi:hypothetical protein